MFSEQMLSSKAKRKHFQKMTSHSLFKENGINSILESIKIKRDGSKAEYISNSQTVESWLRKRITEVCVNLIQLKKTK